MTCSQSAKNIAIKSVLVEIASAHVKLKGASWCVLEVDVT